MEAAEGGLQGGWHLRGVVHECVRVCTCVSLLEGLFHCLRGEEREHTWCKWSVASADGCSI